MTKLQFGIFIVSCIAVGLLLRKPTRNMCIVPVVGVTVYQCDEDE